MILSFLNVNNYGNHCKDIFHTAGIDIRHTYAMVGVEGDYVFLRRYVRRGISW
jgi:hypothetical protein